MDSIPPDGLGIPPYGLGILPNGEGVPPDEVGIPLDGMDVFPKFLMRSGFLMVLGTPLATTGIISTYYSGVTRSINSTRSIYVWPLQRFRSVRIFLKINGRYSTLKFQGCSDTFL